MSLYNSGRIKQFNSSMSRFVELREHFQSHESKSVAEPIRILKEAKAACSSCKFMKPHRLMFKCTKNSAELNKIVKPYNLCIFHTKHKTQPTESTQLNKK